MLLALGNYGLSRFPLRAGLAAALKIAGATMFSGGIFGSIEQGIALLTRPTNQRQALTRGMTFSPNSRIERSTASGSGPPKFIRQAISLMPIAR
jgi:hypothetical protein